MIDLFGHEVAPPATHDNPRHRAPERARGYARRPGSGPSDARCKHCDHIRRVNGRYFKCALLKAHWNHSYGTDIRANAPACEAFVPAAAGQIREVQA